MTGGYRAGTCVVYTRGIGRVLRGAWGTPALLHGGIGAVTAGYREVPTQCQRGSDAVPTRY